MSVYNYTANSHHVGCSVDPLLLLPMLLRWWAAAGSCPPKTNNSKKEHIRDQDGASSPPLFLAPLAPALPPGVALTFSRAPTFFEIIYPSALKKGSWAERATRGIMGALRHPCSVWLPGWTPQGWCPPDPPLGLLPLTSLGLSYYL